MKGNIAQIPGVAVFSDELRDGLCGPVGDKRKGAFLADSGRGDEHKVRHSRRYRASASTVRFG